MKNILLKTTIWNEVLEMESSKSVLQMLINRKRKEKEQFLLAK